MEFNKKFSFDITVQDIFLATRIKLNPEIRCPQFNVGFDRGSLLVYLRYK